MDFVKRTTKVWTNVNNLLVRNFFSEKLKLHAKHIDDIKFVRCHRIGKQYTDNWNAVKGDLMLELVRAKYDQNDDLKSLLLETADWEKLGKTRSFQLAFH